MDNVACYGSEEKLSDCTYHKNTIEDEHINDVWINCNATGANEQATQTTFNNTEIVRSSVLYKSTQDISDTTKIVSYSVTEKPSLDTTEIVTPSVKPEIKKSASITAIVALAVATGGLGFSVLVIIFLIVYIVYNRNKKLQTSGT